MAQKRWKYVTPRDRVVTTTSAAAGLAVFGAGLAVALNPVALAAAGGIALLNYGAGRLFSIPAYRRMAINSAVKKGTWEAVPDDAPASRITAEISKQMGRKEAPKIFTVDDKTLAKSALPFGLRWIFKGELRNQAVKSIFAALPGANTIITTKEALNNGLSEDQLRFIAAHEMSHLQAKDNRTLSIAARVVLQKVPRALFWGSLTAGGVALFGASLPILAGGLASVGIIAGATLAGRALNNFGLRTVEQRADRNGLYITRDLDSAKSAFAAIDPTAGQKTSLFKEMFLDHPSNTRRVKIMTKAFQKVCKYQPVEVPTDPATAKPALKVRPPQPS